MTAPMPLMTPQSLPRGGVVVKTSAGLVQVGVPPETIKDTMALGLDVPTTYVVPKEPKLANPRRPLAAPSNGITEPISH